MKHLLILFFTLLHLTSYSKATEYIHILNDRCINELYNMANEHFKDNKISIIRDSRGLILRFFYEPQSLDLNFGSETYEKLYQIELFLAKIENPAIIEVHTGKLPIVKGKRLKNWELSTIIANNVEAIITKPSGTIDQKRINSVGYGEFLPTKNTSNNGGKNPDRIDIIVLCNIDGE